MKRISILIGWLLLPFSLFSQRGQVHGSEWDDGGSTSIGNLLRVLIVVGVIYYVIKYFSEYRKEKENKIKSPVDSVNEKEELNYSNIGTNNSNLDVERTISERSKQRSFNTLKSSNQNNVKNYGGHEKTIKLLLEKAFDLLKESNEKGTFSDFIKDVKKQQFKKTVGYFSSLPRKSESQNKVNEALEIIDSVLELDSGQINALYLRAVQSCSIMRIQDKNDIVDAVSDCDEIIKIDSTHWISYILKAELQRLAFLHGEAYKTLMIPYRKNPSLDLYMRMGKAKYHVGLYDTAMEDNKQALLFPEITDNDKRNISVSNFFCLIKLERFFDAEKEIKKISKMNTTNKWKLAELEGLKNEFRNKTGRNPVV